MADAEAKSRTTAPRLPRAVLVAAALLTALMGVFAAAPPAAASAFLVTATPSHGAVVTTAPQEILLIFSERVDVVGDGVAVVGPSGDRVDPGTVRRPRPEVVSVPLPGVVAVTRQGIYTVSWHVVSADARPASGVFTFSIGARPAPAPTSSLSAAPVVTAGYGLAGFAALAGLAVLIGGVTLGRFGGPPPDAGARLRRFAMAGWATLVVATLALLVLRGPYAAGAGPARAFDRDLLGQTLHTAFGRALAVRLVLLGAGPMLLEWGAGQAADAHRRRRAAMGVVAAIALALTWSAAGDAVAPGAPPLALVAAVVELLATTTWLGWLAALPVALRGAPAPPPTPPPAPAPEEPAELAGPGARQQPAVGAAAVVATSPKAAAAPATTTVTPDVLARRFGRLTAGCAASIVLAGGYLAWPNVGSAAGLAGTAYGRLLLTKIILLGGVLALAVRLRATPRPTPDHLDLGVHGSRRGHPGGVQRRVAAAGAAGTALAALVLALTTALAEVQPAAQAQADRPATRSARLEAGDGGGPAWSIELRLPRTLRGVDEAVLTVRGGDGSPRGLPGLQGSWTQLAIGVGPLPVRASRLGAGRYRLDWPPLPIAGGWRLRLTAPGHTGPAAFGVRIR